MKKLGEMETRFRVPQDTSGIVYDSDKVYSRIGSAQFYLGSSHSAPTQSARAAINLAQSTLDSAIDSLNMVLNEDLPAFRTAVSEAGLGLLDQKPVE